LHHICYVSPHILLSLFVSRIRNCYNLNMLRRFYTTALSVFLLILLWDSTGFTETEDFRESPGAQTAVPYPGLDEARLLAAFGESNSAYTFVPRVSDNPASERERILLEIRLLTELELFDRADSLLARHTPIADPETVFLHYLRRGKINLLAGRYNVALDCLEATDSLDGGDFTAYRDFVRVSAELGMKRPQAAIRAGEGALQAGIPDPLFPDFEMAMVLAYSQADRPRDGLRLVQEIRRKTRLSTQKAELLAMEYQLNVQDNNMGDARLAALKLASVHRRNARAAEVCRDIVDILGPSGLSVDELLVFASVFIEHEMYRNSKSLTSALDEKQLSGSQREERLIVKARYYYKTGDYKTAAALSKPRFDTPAYRRESILILARSYRRMGERGKAADLYVYFARTFPNDGKAAEALFVASRLYDDTGNKAEAGRTLASIRKSYPSSYFGQMAAVESARRYSAAGHYTQSISILGSSVNRSRRTDETAIYYLAQTYGEARDESQYNLLINELRTLDPFSFYLSPRVDPTSWRPVTNSTGRIAMDGDDGLILFLLQASDSKEQARQFLREAVAVGSGPDAATATCLSRGTWFLDAGFKEWGERELEAARRSCLDSPGAMLDLGRIYDVYGLPWHSISVYQKVKDSIHWEKRKQYADQFRHLMYPVPYPVQVLENADRFDLPPHLVYAMIREESRFDRRAVSRVGALGLMQLMPETGRYVARELEVPEWAEDNLLDPATNLAFGVWYSASLMDNTGEDYLRMLAAYNAGPRNAKRWFGRGSTQKTPTDTDIDGGQLDASTIEVVDGIDYKETRLYVQRIVESANIYRSLYFSID
jgi:soluble lytic murein transglycosylase